MNLSNSINSLNLQRDWLLSSRSNANISSGTWMRETAMDVKWPRRTGRQTYGSGIDCH
jgi:hypothetical protein